MAMERMATNSNSNFIIVFLRVDGWMDGLWERVEELVYYLRSGRQ
jgi:hypothetical protein